MVAYHVGVEGAGELVFRDVQETAKRADEPGGF